MLADVLADPVQRALAARAGLVLDVDERLDARQMGRQGAAVGAPFARSFRARGRRLGFVRLGLSRLALLDVFERQQQLIFRQALGAATKAVALQFLDDRNKPFCPQALGDQHRLQRLGIVGKRLGGLRHARRHHDSWALRRFSSPDSLRRRSARQLGAGVSFAAPTRLQSRPSTSAESCAADSRITPFSIFGHWNRPSSRRLANRHTPVPSQNNSFTRSATFGAEHIDRPIERFGPHHVANQRRQPFRPFAEVDRPRRDEHAHRA